MGINTDISNLCGFSWYEWCYYQEKGRDTIFPNMKEILGRVLGPSKNEGNEMAKNFLTHKDVVVPRCSVQKLTDQEWEMKSEKSKRADFDRRIKDKLGDLIFIAENYPEAKVNPDEVDDHAYDSCDDDGESPTDWVESGPTDQDNVLTFKHSLRNTLVNAEVLLSQHDKIKKGKFKQRHQGPDRKVTGIFNKNSLLNSIIYDVEFPDGTIREYAANIIAENIYYSLDEHGH